MENDRQRITLKDIARETGVSRATVSYVLSNDSRQTISSATREKVLEASSRLGYQVYAPARLLRTGRSSIALAVIDSPQIASWNAFFVEPIAAKLAEHNFTLLWQIGINLDPLKPHPVTEIAPAVVISMIVYNNEKDDEFLRRFGAPIVEIVPRNRDDYPNLPQQLQIRHLVEKRHRVIAFATSVHSEHTEAFKKEIDHECAVQGLPKPEQVQIPKSRAAARLVVAALLAKDPPPTAICTINDETAVIILAALADLEISVPDRVAVIGLGNDWFGRMAVPALTTVDIENPTVNLNKVIDNIMAVIRGEPIHPLDPLSHRLIVRKST